MKQIEKLQMLWRIFGSRAACISVAVAVLGLSAVVPSAHAITHQVTVSRLTEYQTDRKGGTQGFQYNLSCPEARVLVGVKTFSSTTAIVGVQGICRSITSTGAWASGESLTAFAGQPNNSTITRKCPSGKALSGFSGNASSGGVNSLRLYCRELGSDGFTLLNGTLAVLPSVGGTGGSPFNVTECGNFGENLTGNPARAIAGRHNPGLSLVSFQFACSSNPGRIISDTAATTALLGASNFLTADAGADDVPCSTLLQRTGPVAIEPGNGSFHIDSQADLDRACNLPGLAVVVDRIDFCNEFKPSILGCAKGPSNRCMVMENDGLSSGQVSQLWAHEFGHTQGLGHNSSNRRWIMHPTIHPDGLGSFVTPFECTLGFAMPSSSSSSSSSSALVADASSESAPAKPLRLGQFVSQIFIHGMPYEQARAYGSAAVPALIAVLRDPLQLPAWSNAAVMLGMIGDQAAVEAVIEFIRQPGLGLLTRQRSEARRSAVMALGYAAHEGNETALWYLMDSLTPRKWRERMVHGADDSTRGGSERVEDQLTRQALLGLALSGRAEARAVIDRLKVSPAMDADLLDTVRAEHGKVSRIGLRAYSQNAGSGRSH